MRLSVNILSLVISALLLIVGCSQREDDRGASEDDIEVDSRGGENALRTYIDTPKQRARDAVRASDERSEVINEALEEDTEVD